MSRKLIKNAWVVSVDPTVGEVPDCDILIEDQVIREIKPGLEATGAEVIDATGMVAIPGFIDTHRHTWQALVRGVGCDWTLDDYFQGIRGMLGWHYRPEDVYAANLVGVYESLNAGITTLLDWSHIMNTPEHADAAINALQESGSRAMFAHGDSNANWQPVSDLRHSEDVRRLREQYFSSDDQLVNLMVSLRGPQWATIEATIDDFRLAREVGAPITVHVGDGLWGIRAKPVEQLEAHGLLADDTTYVHCNSLSAREYQLMADSGGTASVSAELEMHMGHGYPPIQPLLNVGIRPSLSIDVVDSVPGDMFGAMRATLAMHRAVNHQKYLDQGVMTPPGGITTRDVLEFATLQGARACGIDRKVGSLTPGKQADIVLVNTNAWNLIPFNDALGTVVGQATIHNVDTVLVAGNVVKRDGRLVGVDFNRVKTLAEQSRDYLLGKVGVEIGQRWFDRVEDNFQAANR
ncbi:MAG TPA: amidohydrolase family protein [Pseudonocardiaceae bacterium]|nr:amidohydrolase family protein [Pseudonocardiaceae bacterium]